jgi:phosphoglycolate phosphatase-like HAD superfamily hydrolase
LRALVLWDIDGTLVDSAKLGRDAFIDAFERVTGRPPAQLVPFAGRTDLEIAADMLERSGEHAADGTLAAFEQALEDAMADRAEEVRRRGRAYPGARQALARLGREPHVVQGLLTGNIPANAWVKLAAVGLDGLLDFDIGAYGSDHHTRSELVAVACDRAARKLGVAVAPAQAVLVGDTPLDVAAALAAGARAVGVATGPFGVSELHEAGADAVLADLCDSEAVAAAVLGT